MQSPSPLSTPEQLTSPTVGTREFHVARLAPFATPLKPIVAQTTAAAPSFKSQTGDQEPPTRSSSIPSPPMVGAPSAASNLAPIPRSAPGSFPQNSTASMLWSEHWSP